MNKRQALDRLKAAQIDIYRDLMIDIIDEIVHFAAELGISDPVTFGDKMAYDLLNDAVGASSLELLDSNLIGSAAPQ